MDVVAANENPKYPKTPNVGKGGLLQTQNQLYDGTGANIQTVFTAGLDGAFFERVLFKAVGTNIQTVVSIFLNDGAGTAAANNAFIGEMMLPATTLTNTNTTPQQEFFYNKPIPAGYKINCCVRTTVAAGWYATGWGGDY